MTLQYMVCDSDLAKAPAAPAKTQPSRPQPVKTRGRRSAWLLPVLIANLLLFIFLVCLLTNKDVVTNKGIRIWRALIPRSQAEARMVTGIMYSQDNPSAVVRGQVVHEGEQIEGYTVIRIGPQEVEFEKDGQHFIEKVH